MLEHDIGIRDPAAAQSPDTNRNPVTVDECFVELRITGWDTKGNYRNLIIQ